MRPSDAASWVQRCYWSRQTREEDGIVLLAYGVVKTGFDSLNIGASVLASVWSRLDLNQCRSLGEMYRRLPGVCTK